MELNTETEVRILEAASKVFYLKGKDGASMQEIANEANITRTSLNYYYRSKDKLFEAVFRHTMDGFIPGIASELKSQRPVEEYLPVIVEKIIDAMIAQPQIPVFVLQELSSNPARMTALWREMGIDPAKTVANMQTERLYGNLPFDLRHLVMNVISMCVFPFAAKPLMKSLLYENDEEQYVKAMEERKTLIPLIIEKMSNSFGS